MVSKNTGRPPKLTDKDKETFEELCRIQCTEAEVCSVLKVNRTTLNRTISLWYADYAPLNGKKKTFDEVFKILSIGGKTALRRAMFKQATEQGNVTMMIFLAKQYLGMCDNPAPPSSNEQVMELAKAMKESVKALSKTDATSIVEDCNPDNFD